MKKSIIIILAVVAILVIWAVSVYNGLSPWMRMLADNGPM